jgi:hypothetical protein
MKSGKSKAIAKAKKTKAKKTKAKKTSTSRQPPRTVRVPETYLDELRKAVGGQIDPETAEVAWTFAQAFDPYNDGFDIPEEMQYVDREYFARSPGSNLWILFSDLPQATFDHLLKKTRI